MSELKIADTAPLNDEIETLLENCKHQDYDMVIVIGVKGSDIEHHNTKHPNIIELLGALEYSKHIILHIDDEDNNDNS